MDPAACSAAPIATSAAGRGAPPISLGAGGLAVVAVGSPYRAGDDQGRQSEHGHHRDREHRAYITMPSTVSCSARGRTGIVAGFSCLDVESLLRPEREGQDVFDCSAGFLLTEWS